MHCYLCSANKLAMAELGIVGGKKVLRDVVAEFITFNEGNSSSIFIANWFGTQKSRETCAKEVSHRMRKRRGNVRIYRMRDYL